MTNGSSGARLLAVPGADIEHPPSVEMIEQNQAAADVVVVPAISVSSDIPIAPGPSSMRGKVNEIDFCIAPADASLSRAYGTSGGGGGGAVTNDVV